ncbi:MAG: hypothetical protein P4M01_00595 [Acidobacteriota bacterium]|nr:hypothetical protein [Acidobacteriota bacterium]
MHGLSRAGSLALMAVLGILCVFLHPVAIGPLVASHGQTTAFRALVAASKIFAAMQAAFGIPAGVVQVCMREGIVAPALPFSATSHYALRC